MSMNPDLQIAQQHSLKPIEEIAASRGLTEEQLERYGRYKAKLTKSAMDSLRSKEKGKLVLVTAMNPTPAGEGKSTVTVGLGDALNAIGKQASIALREPSLGPVMGLKGGAAGGGYAQVVPMEDINLHFTGDLHAITTAHNTAAAILDNHLHQGNTLGIDPRRIVWKRVLDCNDRSLRQITIGLGGPLHGIPRQDGFDITVASEVMAVFCLADDFQDLAKRIKRIIVAYTYQGNPVTVQDIGADGAMLVLLRDAFQPNLVQTLEGTPAFIHGGPFANIAHGCNSVQATKASLALSKYTVTEAGFGADLGAEKFLHIKCQQANLKPSAVVLVVTTRALKFQGGVPLSSVKELNIAAIQNGFENVKKHLETMQSFGLSAVVAINQFEGDHKNELSEIKRLCSDMNVDAVPTTVWADGGKGGTELAKKVVEACERTNQFQRLYHLEDDVLTKIEKIAKTVYGAATVELSSKAKKDLKQLQALGCEHLPICMAKTQNSLSDDPKALGRPTGFTLHIRELKPSIGAGFIVAYAGNILTMPGLPKEPAAYGMSVSSDGKIEGLF